MIKICFKTESKELKLVIDGVEVIYSSVITIKHSSDGFYEIFQRREGGVTAPIIRCPINKTIIFYEHN